MTFEGGDASFKQRAELLEPHEPTSSKAPVAHRRDAELPSHVDGEGHGVRNHAAHRRVAVVVELGEELPEGSGHELADGVADRRDVLGGVGTRRWEAVGDGGEFEVGESVEGVGTSGVEETVVVELGVDVSDVEASVVEELGELESGLDVALSWEWDANGMGLLRQRRVLRAHCLVLFGFVCFQFGDWMDEKCVTVS
ncbi:unnamed protein product [Linum tenue]|uniref:Uncharacterized protein n=1 Tax=Linum tenue TaxID=586396 RepID=A0AAV0LFH8_9ROSI|nr:unnamed protein product [Linum tenue]